ncbi:TPA: restriction endonuclease subunit S [Escherichia coli]|nr:restriction endonuclease subunit S [Escherichia coli]
MSELSYLEKLLDGVEVEWKTLEDISIKISSGGTPKTGVSEFYDGDIPWLRTQEVNFCDIWDTEVKITESGVKNSSAKWIPKNCVIVAMYGATVGKIGINKIPMTTNQACANIQLNEEVAHYRYVFHFLCSQYTYIKSLGTGSQTNINAQIVKNIKIPIPCPENPEKSLAIQSEIVRILDKFSALTAELTAELNMRKKQYNYYRDQLLSFDEEQEKPVYLEKLLDGVEVEWRTLGEIAVIYDGTHKTPKYTASGVPFVSVQNIKNLYGTNKYISPEDFKTYKNKPRKHDLFMTRIGDVGTCAIVEDDRPLAYYVTLALIRINQQIAVPGFIRYLIESRFGKAELYKRTLIHAVPMKINLGEIGKVAVPIPCPDNPEKSLAIQSEIVRILDKFDTLTNSITEGLPREIELRQKQYEYYRDLLFSFPKPETVSN